MMAGFLFSNLDRNLAWLAEESILSHFISFKDPLKI